jgi:hypothetical protein
MLGDVLGCYGHGGIPSICRACFLLFAALWSAQACLRFPPKGCPLLLLWEAEASLRQSKRRQATALHIGLFLS